MNLEPTPLLLGLQALNLLAVLCWVTGQAWMWRVQVAGAANRQALRVATSLAATLALFSGAGLLAL
jgi:hypothetical protein